MKNKDILIAGVLKLFFLIHILASLFMLIGLPFHIYEYYQNGFYMHAFTYSAIWVFMCVVVTTLAKPYLKRSK